MAGLEGIDASAMEIVDALGARFVYDSGERVVKPVVRHTDFIPVARCVEGERVLERTRFGLSVGPRVLTNARSDNLASPAWKGLYGKPEHHALAAVSYVIERDAKGNSYRIQRRDGKTMAVAALAAKRHYKFASTGNEYDDWGHVQLTADANPFVAQVHGRFVVELPDKAARDAWMAAEAQAIQKERLLVPAPDDRYEMVPISPDVWKKRDAESVMPRGPPLRGIQARL